MNSPTGINSCPAMCGTHETKVYFNQVKLFYNFRNRIDYQNSRKSRGFSGGAANVLGRVSIYRVYGSALSTTAEGQCAKRVVFMMQILTVRECSC